MRFAVATLCDAASVRDGLLNVLGAGITVISRDQWPAPIGATLAFLVEIESNEFQVPFNFSIELTASEFKSAPIATIEGGFGGSLGDVVNAPIQLPVIVPMNDVLLPGSGSYECTIDVADGKLRETLSILAQEVPRTFFPGPVEESGQQA